MLMHANSIVQRDVVVDCCMSCGTATEGTGGVACGGTYVSTSAESMGGGGIALTLLFSGGQYCRRTIVQQTLH